MATSMNQGFSGEVMGSASDCEASDKRSAIQGPFNDADEAYTTLAPDSTSLSLDVTAQPTPFPEPGSVDDFLFELDAGIETSLESDDTSSIGIPLFRGGHRDSLSRLSISSSETSSTKAPSISSSLRSKIASFTSAGAFCTEYLDSKPYRIYSVRTFCESLFSSRRALDAKIVSVARYGDVYGIPHRFLILHVARVDGRDFYLRLDRRRDNAISLWKFGMVGSGTSNTAMDTAAISGRLGHLLDYTNTKAGVEAVMGFSEPAPLIAAAQILYAVTAESPGYRLSRENCWFFASTIQEMLTCRFGAVYKHGSLNHPNIGAECRDRIRVLVYSSSAAEINDLWESVLRLTALIGDSIISKAVKSILKAMENHHRSAYRSFSGQDAFHVSSLMKRLLVTLNRTFHEHLHGCYAIHEARKFSISFPRELFRAFLLWGRNLGGTSSDKSLAGADDVIALISTIIELLESSLEVEFAIHKHSSVVYDPVNHHLGPFSKLIPGCNAVLSALELLERCTAIDRLPVIWRFQLNSDIPDLQSEFEKLMTVELKFACHQWIPLLCESDDRSDETMKALSRCIPVLLHWIAAMGIMDEIDRVCRGLNELVRWLEFDTQDLRMNHVVRDLYQLVTRSKSAFAASSLSILGSGHPFIPSGSPLKTVFPRIAATECHIVACGMYSSESWPPQVLEVCTSGTSSVGFSPDGRHLASASSSSDGTVYLWDAVTGALLQELKGHTGPVNSVTFSSNGLLPSASDDRTVRVWDAVTGDLFLEFRGHTAAVFSAAFSPDGSHLASDDHHVRIWDVATGTLLRILKGHTSPILFVTFSPDGCHLASGSEDHTVRVWDLETGEALLTLKGHTDSIWSVEFSPDSRYLATASGDHTVRIWDRVTGAPLRILDGHTSFIRFVKFSPDGCYATSSSDHTVRIWSVETGALLQELRGHTDRVRSVQFSPDGRHLASASCDDTMRVWDIATKPPLRGLEGHTGSISSLQFSRDGYHLASTSQDGTVCTWDAAGGRCIGRRPLAFGETKTLSSNEVRSPTSPSLSQPARHPVYLDGNSLCINKGGITCRICWLPDYFKPSSSVAISRNNLCLGGLGGMIAFIDLDGLMPSIA